MKKITATFSAFLIILLVLSPLSASAYSFELNGYTLNSKAAYVVNANTGRVVFNNGAEQKRSVASLTKIMTAVVVLENCGNLHQKVMVKQELIALLENTGLVTAGLCAKERISIEELLYCLLMPSAADAALVLADYVGGSVDSFVAMMNEKAAALGMENTHFVDPHGLHELADGHYSTTKDIANLCVYALKNKTFAQIVSAAKHTVPATNLSGPRALSSTNALLLDGNVCRYDGALGIKTGYTEDAGRCLASAATNGSETYICVVLGCDPFRPDGSAENRHFKDSVYLFESAFRNYSLQTAFEPDDVITTIHDKCFGIDDDVPVVPESSFEWLLKNDESFTTQTTLVQDKLSAPVKKGTKLGECKVFAGRTELATVDLVAGATVERSAKRMALTVLCIALILVAASFVLFLICRVFFKQKRKRPR